MSLLMTVSQNSSEIRYMKSIATVKREITGEDPSVSSSSWQYEALKQEEGTTEQLLAPCLLEDTYLLLQPTKVEWGLQAS